MNLGGYSGGGMHLVGVMLLIFIFVGPYILLWLQFQAFRNSEALSSTVLASLILLALPAGYCAWNADKLSTIPLWLVRFQLTLMQVGVVALPFTIAWESHKRGWFGKLLMKHKKQRK